jgi:amidase
MSVPLFWTAAGLSTGAHFTGRFGDEASLFRLAAQLEASRPWAGRRPPVRKGSSWGADKRPV